MSIVAPAPFPLQVLRVGACSPLGTDSLALAMAARAGLFEPRPTPWCDQRGQEAGAVHARFLPEELIGAPRFLALGAVALAEAGAGLGAALPLLLGLPEDERPDVGSWAGAALLRELATESRVAVDLDRSETIRAGHASFGMVLERAAALLAAGAGAVLVGAIDSYFHPDALRWLDAACRLHGAAAENGLIPAEGAAFALLARADAGQDSRHGAAAALGALGTAWPAAIARILHVGTGLETSSLEPSAPQLARVSTAIVRSACEAVGPPVPWVLSDVNGEHHRIREWAHVRIRCGEWLADSHENRLAETMGDLGAASGAVALALCVTMWATRCAPAPIALVALCSEGAERAAFVAASSERGAPANATWCASEGTPSLHWLEQRAPAPASSLAASSAHGAREHVRAAARSYLTDMAALSGLRVPLDEQIWDTTEPMERRLLACFDALVALGQSDVANATAECDLRELTERYAEQARVPDPGRQFVRAFVLGCLHDEVAARAAFAGLGDAEASRPSTPPGDGAPGVQQAIGAALSLAASPAVGPLARELLGQRMKPVSSAEASAERRRRASDGRPATSALRTITLLEILRFRRQAPAELLGELGPSAEPVVAAAVARVLGFAASAEQARSLLQAMLRAAPEHDVGVEVASSLTRLGAASGLDAARRALDASAALSDRARLGYLRLLALGGDAADLPRVRQALSPSPRDAELVGWYGHVELVPWLLETIGRGNASRSASSRAPHPLEVAAAQALARITGARLRDEPDDEVAHDSEAAPALRAETWQAWWRASHGGFDSRLRYRFGLPYQPLVTLEELVGPSAARARRDGALELELVAGPSRFEPQDFVARQRVTLAAVRGAVLGAAASVPPGSWPGQRTPTA
jgi:3-oxoacyl-[acyl-carrier-protein] synthase I